MQDDRTVIVNADDLAPLAYCAAQGILFEVEAGALPDDYRDEAGRILATAFAHGNLAADPQREALPYAQADVLEALSGALTRA
jgi:hypothetical protein